MPRDMQKTKWCDCEQALISQLVSFIQECLDFTVNREAASSTDEPRITILSGDASPFPSAIYFKPSPHVSLVMS